MSRFVLDASVAIAWFFPDESSPRGEEILALLESSEAVVPPIWPVEVGNALVVGERRKRIRLAEISRSLEMIRSLNIHVDEARLQNDLADLVALARSHTLSVYDAAYLSLAMREEFHSPPWTMSCAAQHRGWECGSCKSSRDGPARVTAGPSAADLSPHLRPLDSLFVNFEGVWETSE